MLYYSVCIAFYTATAVGIVEFIRESYFGVKTPKKPQIEYPASVSEEDASTIVMVDGQLGFFKSGSNVDNDPSLLITYTVNTDLLIGHTATTIPHYGGVACIVKLSNGKLVINPQLPTRLKRVLIEGMLAKCQYSEICKALAVFTNGKLYEISVIDEILFERSFENFKLGPSSPK